MHCKEKKKRTRKKKKACKSPRWGVPAYYLYNSCLVQMNQNTASNKWIWSMSIFPRHLVLSLVILLKITHQLAQICFLIGPHRTCHISLALGPRSFFRKKEGGCQENLCLKCSVKDIQGTIKFLIQEGKKELPFNTRWPSAHWRGHPSLRLL